MRNRRQMKVSICLSSSRGKKKTKNVCFFTDGLFFFQTNKSQWAGRDNIWGYESSKAIKGPTLNEMSENMERVKRFLSQ